MLQLSHPPPKPMASNASKTPISSGRPPTAFTSSRSRTPHDKENAKNCDKQESEKKHHEVKSTGSAKSALTGSTGRDNRVTSRLDDAFAVGEENTQECKQS